MNLPFLTNPLKSAIRTLEGILVVVSDIALALFTVVDPSKLNAKEAAVIIGAQHVALLIQRGLIKVSALQKSVGIDAPSIPAVLAPIDNSVKPESGVKPDPQPVA